MEPKKFQTKYDALRYVLKKEDIQTFVSGLHEIQEAMLEEVVARKEREGFPEASELIEYIKRLK